MSIRIGILGYGNLGRGVECAIKHNPDTELVAVFTRRDPETVKILTETAKVYSVKDSSSLILINLPPRILSLIGLTVMGYSEVCSP